MGRVPAAILLSLGVGTVMAQEAPPNPAPDAGTRADTTSNPVTLAQPVERATPNYVNFYGFANSVYDSSFPSAQPNGSTINEGSWGYEVGGGATAYHVFEQGSLSLSYRGGYREYKKSTYSGGTDQNLSFLFNRALTRRWSVSYTQAAGIFLNGGTYYSLEPSQSGIVELNPYTRSTKFLSSSVTMSYQQSVRLSYQIGGDFFLSRYGGSAPFGTTGGDGSAGVLYRLTKRTTVSGTYSHAYYSYQGNAGQSNSDNAYLTLSHDFSARWHGGISAGVSRVDSSGTVEAPALYLLGGVSLSSAYTTGPYRSVSLFPYFQASVTRAWKRSQLTINGGQNVSPGNGLFLTSRNEYVNGFYSYGVGKWNVGFGGTYSRLHSVSNAAGSYSTASFSGSFGYSLIRYLGLNLRYNYTNYASFGMLDGRTDNRVSFGFVINSKNVPVTLF